MVQQEWMMERKSGLIAGNGRGGEKEFNRCILLFKSRR